MAPWVKALALSLQRLWLLLWRGFGPWPQELPSAMSSVKKKKKKKL